LVAYKKYKQIAVLLSEREAAGLRTYLRGAPLVLPDPSPDLEGVSAEALATAYQELVASGRPNGRPALDAVVSRPVVRIRDRIMRIVERIRQAGRTNFRTVIQDVRSRVEIVVSFLAVLELIKQGQVHAEQPELFGDIEIVPTSAWRADQEVAFDLEFEE
jgi:segregation and condensation protein A